jgi:hypothetical protein
MAAGHEGFKRTQVSGDQLERGDEPAHVAEVDPALGLGEQGDRDLLNPG